QMWTRPSSLAGASATPPVVGGYALGEELGRGATSIVYRATRGAKAYALKLMQERAAAAPGDPLPRFRREAPASARFNPPSLFRMGGAAKRTGRPTWSWSSSKVRASTS